MKTREEKWEGGRGTEKMEKSENIIIFTAK